MFSGPAMTAKRPGMIQLEEPEEGTPVSHCLKTVKPFSVWVVKARILRVLCLNPYQKTAEKVGMSPRHHLPPWVVTRGQVSLGSRVAGCSLPVIFSISAVEARKVSALAVPMRRCRMTMVRIGRSNRFPEHSVTRVPEGTTATRLSVTQPSGRLQME